MELPSKYAPSGLSVEDQRRAITVGSKSRLDSMDLIEGDRYSQAQEDIEMTATDDMEEAQMISDIVASSRIGSYLEASDEMELDRHMLQTTEVSLQGNISYLIIDTNFIISQLRILDQLKTIGERFGLIIVIPIQVVRELDGLKSSHNRISNEHLGGSQDISVLARAANDWIFKCLAQKCPSVKGQAMKEKVDEYATKDDAILDCCLYYKEEYKHTLQILFSNDKNLCLKALMNDVLTVSFQRDMSPLSIAEKIYEENIRRFGYIEPASVATVEMEVPTKAHTNNPQQICQIVYSEIQAVVGHTVKLYMRSEYGKEISLLRGYSEDSLQSIDGAVSAIIRFWRPLFSPILRDHEPFEEYNNAKIPIMIDLPHSGPELVRFVDFWTKLLLKLYEGNSDLDGIEVIRQQAKKWTEIAQSVG